MYGKELILDIHNCKVENRNRQEKTWIFKIQVFF